jgi:hypothetical protein
MISISARSAAASSGRGLLALLDHLLEQRHQVRFVQGFLALAACGDVGVLDRRIHHAERSDPALVAGLHRVFHGLVDVVAQHGGPFFRCENRLFT